MSPYLWHITLETGHRRKSPLNEVPSTMIERLRPHILDALGKGASAIPIDGGYSLEAEADGAFLRASVVDQHALPIVIFGVAPRSRGAAKLWQALHDDRQTLTEAPQPPAAPWLASRIEDPDGVIAAAEWLADYERCIAWTWINMRKDKDD